MSQTQNKNQLELASNPKILTQIDNELLDYLSKSRQRERIKVIKDGNKELLERNPKIDGSSLIEKSLKNMDLLAVF